MERLTPLWSPSEQFIQDSNLNHYMNWLKENRELSFHDYHTLWLWSTEHLSDFWESLWQYFSILHDGTYTHVLTGDHMPFYTWFEGTSVNYTEHIFRNATNRHPAIIFKSETNPVTSISWSDLIQQTASLQYYLKAWGVRSGDRIAAYLPCIPEATVALLATSSLGAIWSSCSPDFGTSAVIDRFSQIEPKVLIVVDGYRYGGKYFDKSSTVQELVRAIPSVEKVITIAGTEPSTTNYISWEEVICRKASALSFERVPFNHPLWILYSSGTTGLPKAITHSHGGILLEQLKYATFHNDIKPGEKCFWYTTTGWMMWNYIHGSLLAGGTMVLYDGSPIHPDLYMLWKFIDEAKIHHFGTSAGFILANIQKGIQPSSECNVSSLRSVSSTGSTLPPEGFDWVYQQLNPNVWLTSISGGTDVCSAFVGGNPMWPVYAGEIQCRALGCKLESYDNHGRPVLNEVGEMVISLPMPSMPIYFWNDPDFKRYIESYFEMFPNVWRHGDWIKITPHYGVIIYGRSDATLNRAGIRIGTSEIYRTIDKISEIKDSLIICIEKKGGLFWMPLFVVLKEGEVLTDDVKNKINTSLRNDYSPKHVPDEIIEVPDIPYTISGKKTETLVKKILMGKDPKEVISSGSLRNPQSMNFFISLLSRNQ